MRSRIRQGIEDVKDLALAHREGEADDASVDDFVLLRNAFSRRPPMEFN